MSVIMNELLQTLIYPTLVGFLAIAWRAFVQRTMNNARAVLVEASKRYAGAILVEAGGDPSEAATIAERMATEFENMAKANFAETLKKLGSPADGAVATMIKGELGKMLSKIV